MSHELRTPLNAIIGMSKMLMTQRFGQLNAKQQDYMTDVTSAGEHLLALINDILDLSKIEAGRMDLAVGPVPVTETVALVLSTVRGAGGGEAAAGGTGAAAAGRGADRGRGAVPAGAVQPAVERGEVHAGGGRGDGALSLAAAPRPGAAPVAGPAAALRFDVEDTGVGIPAADQERIGTEFYQGKIDPARAREGTGLGLALTRRLVQLMGGTFWFRSVPGKGSCFSFALPLRPPVGPPPGGAPAQNGTPRRNPTATGRWRW